MAVKRKDHTEMRPATVRAKMALDAITTRAGLDIAFLDEKRQYEASLAAAAKCVLNGIRHIDALMLQSKTSPKELDLAKNMLISSMKLIVNAGFSGE